MIERLNTGGNLLLFSTGGKRLMKFICWITHKYSSDAREIGKSFTKNSDNFFFFMLEEGEKRWIQQKYCYFPPMLLTFLVKRHLRLFFQLMVQLSVGGLKGADHWKLSHPKKRKMQQTNSFMTSYQYNTIIELTCSMPAD